MRLHFVVVLLSLGLAACAERVSEQKQEYEVTRSGVGKRFQVDLKKHCHRASRSLNLLMRERNVAGFPAPPQGR